MKKIETINEENIVLLQQLKNGSYKAFELLYTQYFDLLYGFVFRLSRSHQQTKELVQDTFTKVWIYRERIDLNLSFKAWLYKIAKNQLLDEWRKQLRTPLFDDYLNHCTNENLVVNSSEDSADFDLFKQALVKAKKKLSPRQREVFEQCKEEGFTATEIAQKLNISEQAVYNYLSQALKIIREELNIPLLYLLLNIYLNFGSNSI